MLASSCLVVRADLVHLIGGFDERFSPWGYEDDDFIHRALRAGGLHEPAGSRRLRPAVLFQCREADLGSDINADGDLSDTYPCRYEVESAALDVIPYPGSYDAQLDGPTLAYTLQGPATVDGADVPGGTLLVVDVPTLDARVLEWPQPTSDWSLTGRRVYGLLAESAGSDFNLDGDSSDQVVFAASVATGVATNLMTSTPQGAIPLLSPSRAFDQGHAAYVVSELEQGMEDLDGDGLLGDFVLYVVR